MKKYENFIDVRFTYNGELGKLQAQSQANYQFANKLLMSEIITHDEYIELKEAICNYFHEELDNASRNYMHFIR